jgi:hypothetical protein
MVWGMTLPSTFGEFWPDGEFVGWYDGLKAYFREQMPEEQKALFDDGNGNGETNYMGYAVQKLVSEAGASGGPDYPPFSPIEPQEPPPSFTAEKRYTSLGSLIKLNDRILALDDALKTIIERLEPGMHQFFPIDLLMPRGDFFPKAYHVLFIGQYHDSFSPENSKEGSWRKNGDYGYLFEKSGKGVSGLAFSKSIFGGSHLWRERSLRGGVTCFSDELEAEIGDAGLRIPKHYRMKEV